MITRENLIKHFEEVKECLAGNLDDLSMLDSADMGDRVARSEARIQTFEYVIKYIKEN